ncbi:MAG: sigma-70 family RNA polymerase sigma factor [Paracoccaceae bacterium]
MRAPWHAIHAQLLRTLDTHKTHTRFQVIRQRQAALEAFIDPAALLDHQHAPKGDHAARNAVLAALVREAQASPPSADLALSLMIIALWPGLDAIYRRRLRHFRNDPALLASEIHARVTEQIRHLDLGRVTRIAATILLNIDRDIGRALQAKWQRDRLTDSLDGDETVRKNVERGDQFGVNDSAIRDSDAVAALENLSEPDAALVLNVAVLGYTQREAAQRHGLTHDAARKSYRRALTRLRRELVA